MSEVSKNDMNRHSPILTSTEESKYQEKCSVAEDVCSKNCFSNEGNTSLLSSSCYACLAAVFSASRKE